VASFIHGKYGLGEVEVTAVKKKVEQEHAVDAMRRIVNGSPGEVTILALGGLTNVAMAMLRDDAFVHNLRGVIFVGGKYDGPGFAPRYNVLVDPEAADVVVRAGVPLLMLGDARKRLRAGGRRLRPRGRAPHAPRRVLHQVQRAAPHL